MPVLEIITNCSLLFFLGGAAWIDHRKMELPLIYIAAGFGAGFLLRILTGEALVSKILPGFLPGMLCLFLAKLTKEAIGYGDALMIIAIGAFCRITVLLFLLFCGSLMAGLTTVPLLILKKRNKKEEIPFMPFLLSGYVLTLAVL